MCSPVSLSAKAMANSLLVGTVDIHQLAAIVKNRIDNTLILDIRSFLEYNASHVIKAINIGCAKLLKRRLQQEKLCIEDFLTQNCHWDVDRNIDIIVYDQNTQDAKYLSPGSFMGVFLQKLLSVYNSVSILKGGFHEFQVAYPHLCQDERTLHAPLTSLSQPCLPVSNHGPTRILPFLYLGSQNDALSKEVMQHHNINYQLNVSTSCPKPDFIQESHFMRIPVIDNYSEKLLPHFSNTFLFLDKVQESGGCALVHCLAGISRSATVAIAYVMRHLKMSSDEAYRYVKAKRATISPNFNFLGQLLEYEKQLQRDYVIELKSEASSTPLFSYSSLSNADACCYGEEAKMSRSIKYGDTSETKTSCSQRVSTYQMSKYHTTYEHLDSPYTSCIPEKPTPSLLGIKCIPIVSSLKELNFTPCQTFSYSKSVTMKTDKCAMSPNSMFNNRKLHCKRPDNLQDYCCKADASRSPNLISPFGLSPASEIKSFEFSPPSEDLKAFEFGNNKSYNRTDSTSTSGIGSEEGSSDFTDSWNDSSYERETDILMDEDYSSVPMEEDDLLHRRKLLSFEDSYEDSVSLYHPKFQLQYPLRRLQKSEEGLRVVPSKSTKKHNKRGVLSKQQHCSSDEVGRAHLLYRAQSCPGMLSSESEDGSVSPDPCVKLRQPAAGSNKDRYKNRYSCSSIDYMDYSYNAVGSEDSGNLHGSSERVCNYRYSMIQVS